MRCLNGKISQDYKQTNDFAKITQIIDQYQVKYSKDLANLRQICKNLGSIKDQLTKNIITLYEQLQEEDIE